MQKIDAMIAELDMDKLRASIHTGEIEPRPYQWLVYEKTAEVIRKFGKQPKPSYVTASVGAGKTIMIAMIARRFQDIGVFSADVDDFMFPVSPFYRLNSAKWAASVANDNHLMPILRFTAPVKFIHDDTVLRLWLL